MSLSPGKRSGGIRIVEIIETEKRSPSTPVCDPPPLASASSSDKEVKEQRQAPSSSSSPPIPPPDNINNQLPKVTVAVEPETKPLPWTCTSCNFVNPEGRGRFCSMCGTPKAWTCSGCNYQNTLGKFCSMCGSARGTTNGGGDGTTQKATKNSKPTTSDYVDKSGDEQATTHMITNDSIPPPPSPPASAVVAAPDVAPSPAPVKFHPRDEDGVSSPSTNDNEITSETIVPKPSSEEPEESAEQEDSKVVEVAAVSETKNNTTSHSPPEFAKEEDMVELKEGVEKEPNDEGEPKEDVPATMDTTTHSSEDSSTEPITVIPAFSESKEEKQQQQNQQPSSTTPPDISTGEALETSEPEQGQAKEEGETGETTKTAIDNAIVDDEPQNSNPPLQIEQQEEEESLSALDDLLVPASPKQSPISSPQHRQKAADTSYYIKSPIRSPEQKKKKKATTSKRSSNQSSPLPSPSQQRPQKPLMDLRHILKKHEKPKETKQSNTEVDFYGSMSAIPFLKTPKKEKQKKGKRPKKKASFDEKGGTKSPKDKSHDLEQLGEKNSNGVVIIKDYTDEDLKLWKSMSALDTSDIAGVRPTDMLPLRPMPRAKKEKPPVDMTKHAERAANRPDEWLHPQDQPQEQWTSPSPKMKVKKEITPGQEVKGGDEAKGLQSAPHL